jgi:outer membrane protein assembly factor BamA
MLSKENLNHFLKTLSSQDAPPIECLALSQVNMQRESLSHLVTAVSSLTSLKKLNVSGNEKLGSLTLQQILKALIKNNTIEDLDVSKTGASNDQQCMQLLGELIQSNRSLRSLNLQKLALTEVATYPIIAPLSSALNVESL